MTHANFLTVGNQSVNTASVDHASWNANPDNAQAGNLVVTLNGSKDCCYPFDTPGVVELATACGLGEQAKEWDKEHKARVKAAEKAAADAEVAEKAEAKAESKAAHKAHG